jgi:hypothetical protein
MWLSEWHSDTVTQVEITFSNIGAFHTSEVVGSIPGQTVPDVTA